MSVFECGAIALTEELMRVSITARCLGLSADERCHAMVYDSECIGSFHLNFRCQSQITCKPIRSVSRFAGLQVDADDHLSTLIGQRKDDQVAREIT